MADKRVSGNKGIRITACLIAIIFSITLCACGNVSSSSETQTNSATITQNNDVDDDYSDDITPFVVKYDANGGSGTMKDTNVDDEWVEVSKCKFNPPKGGYKFKFWTNCDMEDYDNNNIVKVEPGDEAEYFSTSFGGSSIEQNGYVKLYAVWGNSEGKMPNGKNIKPNAKEKAKHKKEKEKKAAKEAASPTSKYSVGDDISVTGKVYKIGSTSFHIKKNGVDYKCMVSSSDSLKYIMVGQKLDVSGTILSKSYSSVNLYHCSAVWVD